MANSDDPRGFEPVGTPTTLEYEVDASNSAAIGKGDPLLAEADGNVAQAAAASGVGIVAVAVGFKNSDGQSISYLPASTAGFITAVPVSGQLFKVQCDSGTAVAATAKHATADLVAGVPSTTSGRSIFELDSSNIGTGQTFRIVDKLNEPNNSWAEHVKVIGFFVENAYDDATSI